MAVAEAPDELFSVQETNTITQLLQIASAFEASDRTEKLTTASPLAQGKKLIAKGLQTTTVYYTTIVPCGLHQIHTFIDTDLKTEDKSSHYLERTQEDYNDHHSISYLAKSFPRPVSDREWHHSIITKVEAEKVIMVSVPCFIQEKEKGRPLRPDRVRAEIRSMTLLTQISASKTRVDFYAELELGGYIPRWVINRELPKFMSRYTKYQEHFQHQRKLNQLTVEDGKNMGIMLMIKKKGESVEERLEAFLSKNEALQQLKTTSFPQLEGMMLALLKNKLFHKKTKQQHFGHKVDVEPESGGLAHIFRSRRQNLNDLTEAEASKIGSSFAHLLLTSFNSPEAVNAWSKDNEVLNLVFSDHAFFEPMLVEIGRALLERWMLGVRFRVFVGLVCSLGDLASDLYIINDYLNAGLTREAHRMIGLLAAGMVFNLWFTLLQVRGHSLHPSSYYTNPPTSTVFKEK